MLKKYFFFKILDYQSTNFHLFALLSRKQQKAALFNLIFFFFVLAKFKQVLCAYTYATIQDALLAKSG